MHTSLKELRKKIDKIDLTILEELNRRSKIVQEIGAVKKEKNEEIFAPHREKALLESLENKNRGPFPNHALRAVFREILSASRSLQSPLKVAYLGPEATFSYVAALKYFGGSTELIPQPSIARVFDSVEQDQSLYGVVPIENTTEGVVGATLDQFPDSPLKIISEMMLPVSHHLLSREGNLRSIQKIYSHSQALAQCRNWLDRNLPGVPVLEVESTGKAAQRAAEEAHVAGIASDYAADVYGLKILRRHIEDQAGNMTRFVILGHKSPVRTGRDKTSILFSVKDEVGVLFRMLEPFYKKKINLTKIESRPLRKKAWEYVFYLDLDGHVQDRGMKEVLAALEKKCRFLKVLGSYPKATA